MRAVFAPLTLKLRIEIEERGVALGQVGDLRRPVVHLRVDVDRVVRAPRRPDHVVPDALEISRDGVRLRASDEQIAPVLEEQAHQRGILIGGIVPNTLVGGQILDAPRPQVERDAAEKRLVLGQVRSQQRIIRLAHGSFERARRQRHGVFPFGGGGSIEPVVAGRRAQSDDRLIGAGHAQPTVFCCDPAAACSARPGTRRRPSPRPPRRRR